MVEDLRVLDHAGFFFRSRRSGSARAAHEGKSNSIFRIDCLLGKEAIMNVLYFRFANAFVEPNWNRNYVANVQVTRLDVGGN